MSYIFEKWCEKLLDCGKRNRLINYKDVKLRAIDVISPKIATVFKKITNGDSLFFYDVDSYIKKHPREFITPNNYEEAGNIKNFVEKQQVENVLSGKINKNQVLCFKQGCDLVKILSGLRKVSNDSLIEKGINVLYMAFGFLKWKEFDGSKTYFQSPLLLVPVSIEFDYSKAEFKVKQYEDEIVVNPTLAYKLKNDYNFLLPKFCDEQHPDEKIDDYLKRVQEYFDKKDWLVSDDIVIGTFSFLKMNMYNDLKENEEVIIQNDNVAKLIGTKDKKQFVFEENATIEEMHNGEEMCLHNVVDADSSQTKAIVEAKKGKSFVLQGPPGTGKSQTITNLIAEFLADGKKVLFVSEKLAALKVVYNNLKRVKLDDFCLELHSHKTNKKEVIAELYKMLSKGKAVFKKNVDEDLYELRKSKFKLDEYSKALHSQRETVEMSAYQMISELVRFDDVKAFEFYIDEIEQKDSTYLIKAIELLKEFQKFEEIIGYDYRKNVWAGYANYNLSYENRMVLKSKLQNIVENCPKFEKMAKCIFELFGIKVSTANSLKENLKILYKVSKVEFFSSELLNIDKLKQILILVKDINTDTEKLQEQKQEILQVFKPEIFQEEIAKLYDLFTIDYRSVFRSFNKGYKENKLRIEKNLQNKGKKLNYKKIVYCLDAMLSVKKLQNRIGECKEMLASLLCANLQDMNSIDYRVFQTQLEELQTVLPNSFKVCQIEDKTNFAKHKREFMLHLQNLNEINNCFKDLEIVQQEFNNEYDFLNEDFSVLSLDIASYVENFDQFENWLAFSRLKSRLDNSGLTKFVNKAIDNNVITSDISVLYKKVFLTQWLNKVFDEKSILNNFTRGEHDSTVNTFIHKDKIRLDISKAQIIQKLSARRPSIDNIVQGSQTSYLLRETNKKIKQKPVRVLLQDIPELVQILKPCFLMSPLSVSTYLSSNSCDLDVVIFDEASQIFPWDAIGAIYRAKQVIVVGDSKQMPPSNFFSAGVIDDTTEDEEFDDALDFESILDVCSTVFNQKRLKWHYRSKNENLIAFSNRNYYDNSLLSFPTPFESQDSSGVQFYFVENGIFDRKTRTNFEEAQKVVNLVFEHFKEFPNRSLGVVAFSVSQQQMIEDLIAKERMRNSEFDGLFDDNDKEPFFVKNLETVQGDERDTIIFSVAYAKDEKGNFIQNFGPLNKSGGERRLNVAITRAKYNVKLVASIKHYDIDLQKTQSVGVKHLKEYLSFAENGFIEEKKLDSDDELLGVNEEMPFETQVADCVRSFGYDVETQVGCSGHKIDVCVRNSQNNNFLMAIECDGNSYNSSKTTRDRDRLRKEILQKLGWKYYRVWSVDWFKNKNIEIDKLRTEILKAEQELEMNVATQEIKPLKSFESEIYSYLPQVSNADKSFEDNFEPYQAFNWYNFCKQNRISPTFSNMIMPLVLAEQPITDEMLLKKVLRFMGYQKITASVRAEFRYKMSKFKQIKKHKDFYYVDDKKPITFRIHQQGEEVRNISLISNSELKIGIQKVVETNISVQKDALFKVIANLLGVARVGETVKTKLEQCLIELKNENIVELNDFGVSIKHSSN